jgi:putative ABC transport system permease protein
MLLGNYITSAIRNLLGHKLFSFINIFGLAIGLAAVMLITLFVRDELSYDGFWEKSDRIYRLHFTGAVPGMDVVKFVSMPAIMRDAFMKDFPQTEHSTRILRQLPTVNNNNNFYQEDVMMVDADINDIFNFKVISGDLNSALSNTTDLVISESIAKKYFGEENPIGKILPINFESFEHDYRVAAVIEDLPENSMLEIKMMVLFNESDWQGTGMMENWLALSSQFYFTLPEGANIDELNNQMPDFIDRNFIAFKGGAVDKESDVISINALNIKDLHLKTEAEGDFRPKGSMSTVIIFSAVSVLILIIASINFMNLSTARASLRAK